MCFPSHPRFYALNRLLSFAGGLNRYGIYHRPNPDRLDIHKLVNAERREFAAIATTLDASKGETGIGGGHTIDEDRARFQVTSQFSTSLDITRPQVATQSKLRIVGEFHRVLSIAGTNDGGSRSECFLAKNGHLWIHISQNRWSVEVAITFQRLATQYDFRPHLDGVAHLFLQRLAQVAARHWSDLRLPLKWITHPQL